MVDKAFLHSLPQNPGVYIMKNKDDKIIYVGKAKNLKNRVNQYFVKNSNHTEKVLAMVSHVDHIEYILVNSEAEALNLECSLIKKNRPKYNILLKDDKGYPYIKITNEPFPRVLLARRVEKDGAKYFGPFISSTSVKRILEAFHKLFKIRTCNTLSKRDKPCLNYHIKRCDAPCMGYITEEEYGQKVKQLTDVLSGRADDLKKELTSGMERAAEELKFEQAADFRDKIAAVNSILERQLVVSVGGENEDIVYLYKENDRLCIQMLYVRGGKLTDKRAFFMNNTKNEDDSEVMRAFLLQYYTTFDVPKKVYLSADIADADEMERYLSEIRGNKVSVFMPQRGDKVRFLEMAKKNAAEAMRLKYSKSEHGADSLEAVRQLAHYLALENVPERIEAYDISHTAGSEVVASMVVFKKGQPARSEYRKFKMKTSQKNDDYGAMKEALSRRLKYSEEVKSEKFKEPPDLIFVDGGLGQVHAALEVAREIKGAESIPIFGIFKDDKHKTRGVISAEKTFEIPMGSKCFTLVTEIQDEMHRVAITYHRLLRSRKNTESEIMKIPGVGKNRFKTLLEHFKTVQALKKASTDEIAAVKGLGKAQAKVIYNALHEKNEALSEK